ncbi:hypothetical protein B0H13DRAFT_2540432 [Mycena leptocephala]|nr:hypothetical protein B0H13DRAFT_2540432 [Mycena leptocephala]
MITHAVPSPTVLHVPACRIYASSLSTETGKPLKAGRRVIVNKPNSTYATHYAYYNTHVCTTPLLADGMVALAVITLTLDAMTFFVLPGSPTAIHTITNCPMNAPQWCTEYAVTGSPKTLDDGHGSRTVTVAVSDFVRGETRASTVQLIFDFSTAGWTRALVPQPNTAIQFYGLCCELSPTGILRLKVDSTALNISSNASAPSEDTSGSTGSTSTAPVTPSKRRKFDPLSPPPSVDSPNSPFASSTSTPSANVTTSMASVPDPNARIGPMHYSQLFQQYPQYMPPPTGAFLPPFLPPQGLYSMPGYSNFQSPYAPYNSRGEYTVPPSVDSRTSTSTRDSDSTDISSASVPTPSTVPVQDNSAFNRSATNPYSYA